MKESSQIAEPSTSSAQEQFLAVSMDSLQPETNAPCDLFLISSSGNYVLYAQEGLEFTAQQRRRLQDQGLTQVYIRAQESPIYFEYLKTNITTIVRNPNCNPQKKAAAVHSACQDIMSRLTHDHRATCIGQAHDIITPTVDLIVSDHTAAKHLVQLTAYDHSTYTHSTNVGIFSIVLAKLLYPNRALQDLERLGAGFFLHDLGKCKVPLEVLNKPGKLDDDEWQIIRKHPGQGYRMIEQAGYMTDEARIITLQHHERDDGRGYPDGIFRDDIHPYARICRLADVFEAITSERPYKQRQSTFAALKIMQQEVVADIDQKLFEHFVRMFSVL